MINQIDQDPLKTNILYIVVSKCLQINLIRGENTELIGVFSPLLQK